MRITQLDAQTYVGPQITAADMGSLRQLKVGTVIVARPEGETGDQPAISVIRQAADAFGIAVHQIPVVSGNITDDDVRTYAALIAGTDTPIFAYCRSGMRATSLWALNAVEKGQSPNEILRMAKAAGFDLTPWLARLSVNAA